MAGEKLPGFGFTAHDVQEFSEFMAGVDGQRVGPFLPPKQNAAVYTKMAALLGVSADSPTEFLAAALPSGPYDYAAFLQLPNWAAIVLEQGFKDASKHAHHRAIRFLGYLDDIKPQKLAAGDKDMYMQGLRAARDWIDVATGLVSIVEPLHALTTPTETDRHHVDNYSQPIGLTENRVGDLERRALAKPLFSWSWGRPKPPGG